MNKSGAVINTLPNLSARFEKEHIPIRSITYKKKAVDVREFRLKRDSRGSLPEISPGYIVSNTSSPQLKDSSTAYTRTERNLTSPRLTLSFHKLKFGEKVKSATHKLSSLTPTKPVSRPRVQLGPLTTRVAHTDNGDEHNYFKLLFDEKRKRFNVDECEGVDEFYTNEMIMSRIHKHGFRDSNYYSTRVRFDTQEAPDEQSIKENYMLKISPWVTGMENEKTQVTHVLGGSRNNISYVESVILEAQQMSKVCKEKKKELRGEIKDLNNKFEKEIASILEDFQSRFGIYDDLIKEDVIANQTLRFKLQKELMLLKREKINLENKIGESVEQLHKVENTLYGRNVFELEVGQPELENIQSSNLRSERCHLMENSKLIH